MHALILGRIIPIKVLSKRSLELLAEDKDAQGYWDGDAIYILDGLSEAKTKRIITHEIAHAVLAISGLSNLLDNNLEEAICDAFETLQLES